MKHAFFFGLLLLSAAPVFSQTGVGPEIPGYAKAVSGETIGYTSFSPMATEALLTRCNTGEMSIEWLTAPVPVNYIGALARFVWIGGNSSGTSSGNMHFDLYINNRFALTIETNKQYESPGWEAKGKEGVSVRFVKKGLDKNNDMSGEVTLLVPRKLITPGKPLLLKIVGQKQNSADWLMVYMHVPDHRFYTQLLPLLSRGPKGDTLRHIRLFGEFAGNAGELTVQVKGLPGTHRYSLKKGYNQFDLALPYGQERTLYVIQTLLNGKQEMTDSIGVTPLVPLEVHLIHHSHTDVGYSHLQEQVARIHNENIREAIDLIQKTSQYPFESQFRYNIESSWAVENFLDSSDADEVAKFAAALKTGRLNIAGFFSNNLSGIMRGEEFVQLTQYARYLDKRFGIHINSAMITDIPGYTLSLVKAMQLAGIRYFSVGPNSGDRIGTVLKDWGDKPFYWKAPGSDAKVLTYVSGDSYAWFHSIAGAREPALLTKRLLDYIDTVNRHGYPYHYLALRYNIVSDNAPLDPLISDFVRDWNQRYIYPRLVLSTPQMVLGKIEKEYGSRLPVMTGDMTPYWEDGAASTAAELALNKRLGERTTQEEKLWALLHPASYPSQEFYKVWRGILLFDEHTWGAWSSISDPDAPFSVKQWLFKRHYVTDADSMERRLDTRLRAAFFRKGDSWNIINTNSWPQPATVLLKGLQGNWSFQSADGKDLLSQSAPEGIWVYVPVVPALQGIQINGRQTDTETAVPGAGSWKGYVLDNEWATIRLDSVTGAIRSWYSKKLETELVQGKELGLNQYLYVPGRDPADAQSARVKTIRLMANGPLFTEIRVEAEAPGTNGLIITYRFNNMDGSLTMVDHLEKTKVRSKEAVHFAFPFQVPDGRWMADNGFLAYDPLNDTIPGNNKDFSYTGKWADLSNDDWGISYMSQDAPIVEFGEMVSEVIPPGKGVKQWKQRQTPSQLLYSYALNNYWHTNYKADQEGPVSFSYTIRPHGNPDISEVYRQAEQLNQPPAVIQSNEALAEQPPLLLSNNKVVVTAMKVADDGRGLVLRLYNTSENRQGTGWRLSGGEAFYSNLSEERLEKPGPVIQLLPFETLSIRIDN